MYPTPPMTATAAGRPLTEDEALAGLLSPVGGPGQAPAMPTGPTMLSEDEALAGLAGPSAVAPGGLAGFRFASPMQPATVFPERDAAQAAAAGRLRSMMSPGSFGGDAPAEMPPDPSALELERRIAEAAKGITPEMIARARRELLTTPETDTGGAFWTDDAYAASVLAMRQIGQGAAPYGLQAGPDLTGWGAFVRNAGQSLAGLGRHIPGAIGEASEAAMMQEPGRGVGGFLGTAAGGALPSVVGMAFPPAMVPVIAGYAGSSARQSFDETKDPIVATGVGVLNAVAEFLGFKAVGEVAESTVRQIGRAVLSRQPAAASKIIANAAGLAAGSGAIEAMENVVPFAGEEALKALRGHQDWGRALENILAGLPEQAAMGFAGGALMEGPAAAARRAQVHMQRGRLAQELRDARRTAQDLEAERRAAGLAEPPPPSPPTPAQAAADAPTAATMPQEPTQTQAVPNVTGDSRQAQAAATPPTNAPAGPQEPTDARQEEGQGQGLLNQPPAPDSSIPPAPPELGAPRVPQSERPQVGAKPLPGAAVWQGGRVTASIDEIPAGVAARAFSNTSHVPDQRGEQYRRMYVEAFDSVAEPLRKMAATPEQAAALEQELATFRDGLRSRFMAFLEAHARVASPMITGPARFPVAANAKRIASADRRRAEIGELQAAARNAIVRKLFPQAAASVSSDIADAEVILRRQAAEGRRLQEAMIAANKMLRKGGTHDERAAALRTLGFGDQVIDSVLRLDHAGRVTGFPQYRLKNNLANVKRIEGRIAELARRDASTPRTAAFDGGAVVENPTENRVQIAFEKKPDGATLERLRRAGFRWSHSRGVWQRLRNEAGWQAALQLTGAKQAASNAEVGRPASATVPGDRAQPGPESPSTPAGESSPPTQQPTAAQPAPTTPTESVFDRIERRARERMAKRAIPRGRNVGGSTLPGDLADVAVIAAARIGKLGERAYTSAKAIAESVRKTVADLRPDSTDDETARIERAVRRLLKKSQENDRFSDELFERAVAEMERASGAADAPSVKESIRQSTGQTPDPKTVSEPDALKAGMRKAESAARKAFQAGRAQALESMRAAVADARSKARSRERSINAIRDAVAKVVEEYVPSGRQHAFTKAIADAKTITDYWRVMARAQREAMLHVSRTSARSAIKAVKKAGSEKMLEQYRAQVEGLKADLADLRKQLAEATSPAAKARLAEGFNLVEEAAYDAIARNRHEQNVMVLGRIHTAAELRRKVVAAAVRHKQMDSGGVDPKGGPIRRADVALMTMDALGRDLGDPTFHAMLSEDLWDRETAKHAQDLAGREALAEAMQSAGFTPGSDEVQRWSAEVMGGGKRGWKRAGRSNVTLGDGRVLEMTPAEHMALYGTLTDGDAGPQIASGRAPVRFERQQLTGEPVRLGPGDAERIIDALDPKMREIVDRAKQFIEREIRPGVFEAFREQKGYDLIPVENYYRTRRDRSESGQEAQIVRTNALRALKALEGEHAEGSMRHGFRQALENLGFLKPRTGGSSPYLIGDFFGDYTSMVQDGSTVAHMTRAVRQLESVTGNPTVRSALTRVYGKGITRHLDRFTQDAKLMFRPPRTNLERVHQGLVRNISRAVLTLNPSAMLKNIGGVFKLIDQINPVDLAAGMRSMYSRDVNTILKTDGFFRERYDGTAYRRVSPMLGERLPMAGETSAADAAVRMLKVWRPGEAYGAMGDLIDRLPLYDAADAVPIRAAIAARLHEAKRIGIPEADRLTWAARQAQHAVRRTQNTASALDMSNFAAENRGGLATSITIFKSDAYKAWSMLRGAAGERGVASARFARALSGVALNSAWASAVTAGLSMAAIRGMMGVPQDDKDRTVAENFVRAFLRNTAGMVPGLEETVLNPVLAAWDTKQGRTLRPGTLAEPMYGPVFDVVAQLAEASTQLGSAALMALEGDDGQRYLSGPRKGELKAGHAARQGAENLLRGLSRSLGIPAEPLVDLVGRVKHAAAERPQPYPR